MDAVAVVDSNGRIVDWTDGDGDGGNIRVSAAIIGFVGEAIYATEVGCGCVDE